MKVIVAELGKFLETLALHAGSDVAVLPGEFDWTHVTDNADPFGALLQCQPLRCPIGLQG